MLDSDGRGGGGLDLFAGSGQPPANMERLRERDTRDVTWFVDPVPSQALGGAVRVAEQAIPPQKEASRRTMVAASPASAPTTVSLHVSQHQCKHQEIGVFRDVTLLLLVSALISTARPSATFTSTTV